MGDADKAMDTEYTSYYDTQPSMSPPWSIAHPRTWPKRYIMCALLFLSNVLCYADRTNIGIAVLQGNISLASEGQRGQVLAGFFYGYILTQMIGGVLSSKYGGKPVLLMGVCVWVLCDGLTVPAAATGVFALLMLARIGMGIGEGVNFPADHQLISSWFVGSERSGFLAVVSAGMDVGTIISSGLSPWIASEWGWQAIYVFWCFIGALWLLSFALLGASKPEWHPTITASERQFIVSNRNNDKKRHAIDDNDEDVIEPRAASGSNYHSMVEGQPGAPINGIDGSGAPQSFWQSLLLDSDGQPVPWSHYLRSKSLYGIMCAHFFLNYSWYVFLSWLPAYFSQHLGVDLSKNSFSTSAMPYICGTVGSFIAGWISNYLIAKNVRVLYVRIAMNSIGSFLPAAAMAFIAIQQPTDVMVATVILSIGFFFFRFCYCGYWASMIDIGRAHSGQIMGISNTVATIPGIVGNVVTGHILDATGSWSLVFALAAGSFALAGISFALLANDVDIGEEYLKQQRAVKVSNQSAATSNLGVDHQWKDLQSDGEDVDEVGQY